MQKNPTVSSLNKFSKNIDEAYPGYREAHCHVIKKIKIKTITLNKFCKFNKINNIQYLHIDTQGNDLKILKGLRNYISNVQEGVLEAAISKKKSLYKNNHTLFEVKKFLNQNNFLIKKISFVDKLNNEVNIFFQKKTFIKNKAKSNYNHRYFQRVLDNRTYLKDDIKDFLKRYIRKIF